MEAGLSQEALAVLTGLSARGISDLERGQRRYPRLETVRLIAEALALGDSVRAELVLRSRPPTSGQDARRSFAASTTAEARRPQRQALPVLASQLIGRDGVVSEVVGLLRRADRRLVTLTGPGGAGKSRLALQVATEMSEAYQGGVACVFLASIAAGAPVLPAIADALGVRETGVEPLAQTLGEFLGETRFLLILDNFEHVIGDAVAVNGLLGRCPNLDVLVTSRAALRLRSEHVFQVEPLDMPAPGTTVTVDDLARHGALELFVERARMASTGFDVTGADVPVICEICRRLDGLPLAIELAAARTRVLSLVELLEQLQDRLSLLIGGPVDLPVRHQTLRDTIRWSYDLLSDDDRRLFRMLAIFSGGWAIPAAASVASGSDDRVYRVRVIDGLTSLIENNLVQRQHSPTGESRFDMLDTIRAFGLEMLAVDGEDAEAAQRHFTYFHGLVIDDITSGPQAFHPGRVEADIDNVRAALRWAINEHSAVNALTLAAALREFWSVKGLTSEGRRWLDAALALDGDAPVSVRTAALDAACSHACHQGDLDRAEEYAALSLALNREQGDPTGLVEALHYAGLVAHLRNDFQRARVLYEEYVTLRRGMGNPEVTRTLGNLAQVMFHLGDSGSAVQMFDDCITIDTMNHNTVGRGLLMTDLALILLVTGDNERARDLFRAALPIHHEVGHVRMITYSIQGLATLAARNGFPGRAIRLFGAADGLREAIVHPIQHPDQWRYQESVDLARSQVDSATFESTWATGREMPMDEAVIYALADPSLAADHERPVLDVDSLVQR